MRSGFQASSWIVILFCLLCFPFATDECLAMMKMVVTMPRSQTEIEGAAGPGLLPITSHFSKGDRERSDNKDASNERKKMFNSWAVADVGSPEGYL
jgi:hypothetical protein